MNQMTRSGELAKRIVSFRSGDAAFRVALGDHGEHVRDQYNYWMGIVDHAFILGVAWEVEEFDDAEYEYRNAEHALVQAREVVESVEDSRIVA